MGHELGEHHHKRARRGSTSRVQATRRPARSQRARKLRFLNRRHRRRASAFPRRVARRVAGGFISRRRRPPPRRRPRDRHHRFIREGSARGRELGES